DATLETDPYGGYAATVGDIAYDVGFWRWTFIGASLPASRQKYDTVELYAGATWRWLNLKYWQEVSDYFGVNDLSAVPDYGVPACGSSRGSHYLEGNFSVELGHGIGLALHAGRQEVRHYSALAFSDYRVGLDGDLGQGWTLSIGYSETTANPRAYVDSQGLDAARGKFVAAIHTSF
ncbi:MAG: TorF family putative porin, partial [Pseudomonadota bacterium]|nr:TorF family putative porin [Pseudomonadota bacterium]